VSGVSTPHVSMDAGGNHHGSTNLEARPIKGSTERALLIKGSTKRARLTKGSAERARRTRGSAGTRGLGLGVSRAEHVFATAIRVRRHFFSFGCQAHLVHRRVA
jgi:hypothetical protein